MPVRASQLAACFTSTPILGCGTVPVPGLLPHLGQGEQSGGVVALGGLPGEGLSIRAAGSIGITTVQLAAKGGAVSVAVTTSSPERGARPKELGATHVLNRSGEGAPDAAAGFDAP